MFPVDSPAEMEEQVEWFATEIMPYACGYIARRI
jgi:hypothetical protein